MMPRARLALATIAVLALAFPATARIITPTDAAFTDQVDAIGEVTTDIWPTSGYARGTAGNTVVSGTSVTGSTSFRDEDPPGQSAASGGFSNTGLLFSLNGNASTCAAYTVGTGGPHSNCATPPPSDTDSTSTLNSYNFNLAVAGLLTIDTLIRLASPISTRTSCALAASGTTTSAPTGTVQVRRTLAGAYNSYPMPSPGAPTTFSFNYLGALGLPVARISGEVETTTHLDTTNGVAVSEARIYVEVRSLALVTLATVDTVLGRSECSLSGPAPAAIAMRSQPADIDAARAEAEALEEETLEAETLESEVLESETEAPASTEDEKGASPETTTEDATTITETQIPTTTAEPAPSSTPPTTTTAEPTTTVAPVPVEPAPATSTSAEAPATTAEATPEPTNAVTTITTPVAPSATTTSESEETNSSSG
ncbi:hypothetical protein [Lolliginicoccus suaedae]|uniref:hypothetical protein n=1 Tax=Lolliginicoccus suaedae TaxID=2605429 RepID=UPI0011EBF2AB|nr:hypothetical protein [Lolliginicoccus suaedae]